MLPPHPPTTRAGAQAGRARPTGARRAAVVAALAALIAPAHAGAQSPAVQPPAAQPPATQSGAPAADTARPAPATARPDSTGDRAAAGDSARRLPTPAPADAPAASTGARATRGDSAAAGAARATASGGPLSRAAILAEPSFPVGEGSSPGAILHVQVLLDAAGFSPGMLDARWGENLRLALFTFRDAIGQDADVERVDATTYAHLRRLARDRPPVTTYVLDAADVRGPYRPVPRTVAEKARASCLCYETLLERLSERFHATPALLRALNPGVDFAAARPGVALTVPNTWRLQPTSRVARVVVDKAARGMRGFGADGTVLFWLPATVGSSAMPSPHGSLRVESVTLGPHYRWDPAVLRDVSRREPVRVLPPGPNNLVGSVWVALSRPHVGIHGTPEPERVGYTASHGCVRLTNWDAVWFSRLARPGLAVVFE